ncbi:putative 1-aminocyclopropane-1-carboxylate deaminase [Neofusicoccum parvum]|nr:putative 1-aminocyclopropane-1-carboxylate deaminase [Neofusicoccum parvum]
MSISLLLTATPPTTTRLDNPYTPTPSTRPWPRAPSAAALSSLFAAKRDALVRPPTPVDAASPSARPGARGRSAGGARKGGGGARGGGRRQGGRGGRKGLGGGDGGDDEDGDGDDRERKGRGGAADPIDVPSDDEDDEETEDEDETTPPSRGGVASGLATPPSTGVKAPVEGRGEVAAGDRPPARFFGTFVKRREGFREPPPARRPGRPLPVPREEREAPWGETWWADRAASFDFGETIFATAYQSLQITADLLRNDEGKRPKMAPPSTLPWQSRFGLPQPEDMPSMKAFEKELDGKGVWDLKGPLPELFEGKDGKEVDPLTVFPLHGDVNLPTPPPKIEDTTKRTKGKQRAST